MVPVGTVLFIAGVVVAAVTVMLLVQRREHLWPPSPAWASFTFPFISLVNAALAFNDGLHRRGAPGDEKGPVQAWVALLLVIIVPAEIVLVGYYLSRILGRPWPELPADAGANTEVCALGQPLNFAVNGESDTQQLCPDEPELHGDGQLAPGTSVSTA